MNAQANQETIYTNLSAESERKNTKYQTPLLAIQIESLCPSCEQNGITTLMLTTIPFFKDVVIMAFNCENCGERNSEVQLGSQIADYGVTFSLKMENLADLNRECIKSSHASISIPALQFEIPSNKKGCINTIEGFLSNTIRDLEQFQPVRRIQDPETALKIDEFIVKLRDILEGNSFPIIIELSDPSGDSFIQNTQAPNDDPNLKIKKFRRTLEQLQAMGYSLTADNQDPTQEKLQQIEEEEVQPIEDVKPIVEFVQPIVVEDVKPEEILQPIEIVQQPIEIVQQPIEMVNAVEEQKQKILQHDEHISAHRHDFSKPIITDSELREEAMLFKGPCHICMKEGDHSMCTISIPYFKDIIIMSFQCPHCGSKSTEVKSGGEITKMGKIIKLHVRNVEDLKRDLFKSETASLEIPELELELGYGTLGGLYTTVEGVLSQVLEHLEETNPFARGDSSNSLFSQKMDKLFEGMRLMMQGDTPFTLILKDLVENSFIQNRYFPNEDIDVEVALFERSEDDDEFLGIDSMNTDDYQKQ